ncbi:MAG: molybdate ABC transporter substrate-binding protein [Campylobacterota bacterium]|nr:molybdate ABC transporter substrate-binding protein [Campylobacterota bacterium]
MLKKDKINKKIIFLLLFFTTFLYSRVINIAVAANVSYAIPSLIKEFNKLHPDTKVKVTLGSSGKLTAQISHGAPYDIFMSANMDYPNALYANKIAITKPIIYAQGGLAMLSSRVKDFSKGLDLLMDKSIKKIAIANPKTAPYGKASLEVFKNTNIYKKIKHKLVYSESVSQTVSYALRATDIGIVAKSSLYSSKMKRFKKGKHYTNIDIKYYTPIDQGLVILKKAYQNPEVKNFYDFIKSAKAKNILKDYGYILP